MKAVTDTKYYDEIAYNIGIYGKSGLKPHEMADEVVKIAHDRENYGEEQGREAARTAFWNALQNYGNGIWGTYRLFHGKNWTDEVYQPIYPIKGLETSMSQIYFSSGITDTKVPIIVEGKSFGSCFAWSAIHTIPLLVVNEATNFADAFHNATHLENLTIEGTIAGNLTMKSCSKLTSASVENILTHLKDFVATGSTETKTLTFHSTTLAMLSEETIAEYKEKGWTIGA